MRTRTVTSVIVSGIVVIGVTAGCSGDETARPSTTVVTTSVVAATTTTTTAEPASTTVPSTMPPPAESMRSKRYCEVLLLGPSPSGITATVYNSFPMGDCPDGQWKELDAASIAAEQGAALALLNGPRFWLMDEVTRDLTDVVSETFGTIEMNRYATVDITDPTSLGERYSPQTVDRRSTFIFRAGHEVYTLTADDGRRFVMQSWSQQVEPTLSENDLADLGQRLELPAGWKYEAIALTSDLVVGASAQPAQVLQDELLNSYSLID